MYCAHNNTLILAAALHPTPQRETLLLFYFYCSILELFYNLLIHWLL